VSQLGRDVGGLAVAVICLLAAVASAGLIYGAILLIGLT
jgi:hypothetical protein